MYKKGDREDLTNWRPITLLNTDYKIIAKTLANRLKKVLAYCINIDQTCSVPGRSIVDNCALIRDSIYYCQASNTEAEVISLDQSKAFDRVDREYLFRVLARYGFNPSFIQWIKTLYFSIGSHVIFNNHLTLKVAMERACQSFEDHVYGHCIKWKQYIALASALLHRLGGPAPSASLHPLEFLLQRVQFDSQRSCEYWYVLLLVIYWQKRSKLTAKAMVLSLKFWMRETIRAAATQKTTDSMFNRYWFPFAKKTESRLELHELL